MTESASPEGDNQRVRIRRNAGNALSGVVALWRESRRVRVLSFTLGVLLVAFSAFWFVLTRDLPSAEKLLDYQPPLPTMVRGGDGEIIYSYARERRVQLSFDDLPATLINAFLSAEDKTFWSHGGVDYT
ncbi:MAG: transglycosylase domain-containing protein, partial [Novosphingobium sp.]|nr:transglycosylase domain-containing protein [Novosphingobium sp.]